MSVALTRSDLMDPITTNGAKNNVTHRMVVDHFARNVGRPSSVVASTYFFRAPAGSESLTSAKSSSGDEFSLEPVKKNSNAVVLISQLDQLSISLPASSEAYDKLTCSIGNARVCRTSLLGHLPAHPSFTLLSSVIATVGLENRP